MGTAGGALFLGATVCYFWSMDSDMVLMVAALALAIATFRPWRFLRRRPGARSIKLNFDALKGREMDKHLLAFLVALALLAGAAHAQTPGQGQPKPPAQGPATITDNYGNRRGYVQPSGEVRDNYGNRVGYIKPDGTATDNYGNRVGQVKRP